MICITNQAREAWREEAHKQIVKLSTLTPSEEFTLQDIEINIQMLRMMIDELDGEIRQTKRRR